MTQTADLDARIPGLNRLLDAVLRHLASGNDPALREAATGIRAGTYTLHQVMTSTAYADLLTSAVDAFTAHHEALDPDPQQQLRKDGQASLARLAAGI
ncbi:hypothetical protein [Dactylosporangium sp. NPDC000521]|uniref:hypothetical protein n=1 Tax=Dactylosporangium sp. NPDC000521 TaxID=3363975 RepID=UPI003676B543